MNKLKNCAINFWRDSLIPFICRRRIGRTSLYRGRLKRKVAHVMEEDWDNLIILDACRYDSFRKVTKQKSDYRISLGSCTREFLIKNFHGKTYMDTVYVTANPYINKYLGNNFHKIVSVWKTGWDKKNSTVLPETMMGYGLQADKDFPDKRLIIHFMQPHSPFIAGKYIRNPSFRVKDGRMTPDEFMYQYEKNLRLVYGVATELARKLRGKTVISADHGEIAYRKFAPFGLRISGHPAFFHVPELVEVPWLEINNGERKHVKAGPNKECRKEADKEKEIKDKLRALGYC